MTGWTREGEGVAEKPAAFPFEVTVTTSTARSPP